MPFDRIWQYPFELNWPTGPRGLYQNGGETPSVPTDFPYTGSRGFRHAGNIDGAVGIGIYPAVDDVRFGAFFQHVEPIADADFIQFVKVDQTYEAIKVRWMEDEYRFDLYVDNVKVDETSIFPFVSNWFNRYYTHVGCHVEGGVKFIMTIDGIEIFNYVDGGIPTGYDGVFFGKCASSGWNTYMRIDDFYIDDATGETYEIPPSYRFLYSIVDGDGTSQDWASKDGGDDYEEVDESQVDDDGSYVWTGVSNSPEFFDTANITVPADHSIVAAIPVAVARKGDAVPASTLQTATYDGSYQYGTAKSLLTWYSEIWHRFLLDPSSNPWDQTSFNANEFGFRTQGTI